MQLIRPFGALEEIVAVIEDEQWRFEVVVEHKDPEAKAFEIVYLDIPVLDDGSKRTATVVINEEYLLTMTHAVNHLDHPLLGITDESTFGPDEGTAHMVMKLKRRAVSIVLEDIIDYVEHFVFEKTIEEQQ